MQGMPETSLLHRAKVFSQLSLADLRQVEAMGSLVDVAPKQLVLKAGDAPEHLVVLIAGSLHVLDTLDDNRVCHVGTLGPGDSLGWISVIDGLPTNSHIVSAAQGARVFLIPLGVIRSLLSQRPAFSQAVLAIMASTIRHYMRTRAALSAPNVSQRIYRVILGLAQDAGETKTLVLPKQQDLATLANTSRETVSRTMQELIRGGVLQKNGHQVAVRDLAALQRLAVGHQS